MRRLSESSRETEKERERCDTVEHMSLKFSSGFSFLVVLVLLFFASQCENARSETVVIPATHRLLLKLVYKFWKSEWNTHIFISFLAVSCCLNLSECVGCSGKEQQYSSSLSVFFCWFSHIHFHSTSYHATWIRRQTLHTKYIDSVLNWIRLRFCFSLFPALSLSKLYLNKNLYIISAVCPETWYKIQFKFNSSGCGATREKNEWPTKNVRKIDLYEI